MTNLTDTIAKIAISEEVILNKIYFIRGQRIMIDRDLAELYQVETKRLKEQVNRNINRFLPDYMFELTKIEYEIIRSQIATLKQGEHPKYLPYAFTEHGVLMLSNVLKSERAIAMSRKIIDVFVKIREMFISHTALRLEIEKIKRKLDNQDKNMEIVFRYLDQLTEKKDLPAGKAGRLKRRKRIGYKLPKKK